MRERANALFPFAIALLLPPAGLALALAAYVEDHALSLQLLVTALVGALVWVLLLTA